MNIYSIFHLNLMYSSISTSSRNSVIKNCYWPLLTLADMGIPIGIEATALTLKIIKDLDPSWINKLKQLISIGNVEFIGSGYSQIIGPLVPYDVNFKNQYFGIKEYSKILNITPKTALINEMAYSNGITEAYIENGYDTIIMEWNNSKRYKIGWNENWKFYPQRLKIPKNRSINLIWVDSIAFQQFQRYAHGEITLKKYMKFIKSNLDKIDRNFAIYSSDAEVFNYRPGRFNTEKINNEDEWGRIYNLFKLIKTKNWASFINPSEVLLSKNELAYNDLSLESVFQPIVVKKQEKYNITRWAMTGIDDLKINSRCYQIFEKTKALELKNEKHWKKIFYFWSSDFRTHINETRWKKFYKELITYANSLVEGDIEKKIKTEKFLLKKRDRFVQVKSDNIELKLNSLKGYCIESLKLMKYGKKSLIGTVGHGYYSDIELAADFFSGHTVIDRWGKHKVTDLNNNALMSSLNNNEISINQAVGEYSFENKLIFYEDKVCIKKQIRIANNEKLIIKPFIFTLNPEAWDRASLYVKTHNGGKFLEKFNIREYSIDHSNIFSPLISSTNCFGNTNGIFIIGDKDKNITFETQMQHSALLPSIFYKTDGESFIFRLLFSARALDETRFIKKDLDIINAQVSIY
ncbi:MAG: glycoside hydrolase family 57 [Euryarchaeota archaeon]|nr:glycoside hydrolase family 57 [Euryarchaeota archaeon]